MPDTVTPLKETLSFDGERFVPGAGVAITYHHWLRYFFARQLADDRRVLDVASGEGYGAHYLAGVARSVDAFDASADAVAHARNTYGDNERLTFTRSNISDFFAAAKPGSYDLVTAFEVIEHLDERLQLELIQGIRRVLAPGGMALISTPDKQIYSDARLTKNPFHVREMYRDEFVSLLSKVFPCVRIYDQLAHTGCAIVEAGAAHAQLCEIAWTDQLLLKAKVHSGVRSGAEYLIGVLSTEPVAASVESAVMLDRSQKLIGEELYAYKVELDDRRRAENEAQADAARLRDAVADLEAQLSEIKRVWIEPGEVMRRDSMLNSTIDRLLEIIQRNASEAAQGGIPPGGGATRQFTESDKEELESLRSLLSVQLILKAKRVWDRAPFLKNAVKSIARNFI